MALQLNPTGATGSGLNPAPFPTGTPGKGSPRLSSGVSTMTPADDLNGSFMNIGPDKPAEQPPPTTRVLDSEVLRAALKEEKKEISTPSPVKRDPPPLIPLPDSPASSVMGVPPSLLLPSSPPSALASIPSLKMSHFNEIPKEIPVASIVAKKVSRILQRVGVRSPHVYIGIAFVYLPIKYYWNNESFANEAATFVGVAGIVYCIVRATILEVIPEWMLPHEPKYQFWRHAINLTNTIFITLTFTSAVWKLNISAVQGTACWLIPHALSYWLFSDRYPDIDHNHWHTGETATKS